ncbi:MULTISPECIES: hypothetical protein [unclassified Streptomyces]|uniref:hypothetical protein n=1 Tax=unclassified Streptomyces TaxID=2593676 RepID=UPI0034133480
MTGRLSTDEAVGVLEGDLGPRTVTDPVAEEVWLAFLCFGRRLFHVPDTPDADGLLFQYGTYAFDGPPAFTLDLTRQFELCDRNGDHDHYVQVHCELRYPLTPALEDLGTFTSWFFHHGGDDLEQWARGLTEQPAWTLIRKVRPTEIRVYQEQA